MKAIVIFTAVLLMSISYSGAQESPLLLDKQGVFKKITWNSYEGLNNKFTKQEVDTYFKKLDILVEVVRKNPVMAELKGFDGNARFRRQTFEPKDGYGIPGIVCFEFCHWFLLNGKEACGRIEPPKWDVYVNEPGSVIGSRGFNYGGSYGSGKKAEAADKVSELFYAAQIKETMAKGVVRLPNDWVLIYNPDRPSFWTQVTIREVYTRLRAFWVLDGTDIMASTLDQEYAKFSEKEKDGYAYAGGSGAILQVSSDPKWAPVCLFNPGYWDKSLPKSAIQLLSFYCPSDKTEVTRQKEIWLQHNAFGYQSERFLEALDCNLFNSFVNK